MSSKYHILTSITKTLTPHRRSYRILLNNFNSDILEGQDPWLEDKAASDLLTLLPNPDLRDALSKKWDSAPNRSSERKWADIKTVSETVLKTQKDAKAIVEARKDIVLEYTYPRLDAEVSKKLNHLLKSPFCVHPGTGRVCVPIDTRNLDKFDPFSVPTVTELLSQIDEWDEKHKKEDVDMDDASQEKSAEKKIPDWEKTRLKPYVDVFRAFVTGLLKEEKTFKRERDEGDAMEF
jgi:DNA primase small subunit